MSKWNIALLIVVLSVLTIRFGFCARKPMTRQEVLSEHIRDIADVVALFPKTPAEIESQTAQYIQAAQHAIDAIIAISD